MPNLEIGWERPVVRTAVFWAGIGLALVLYGLYDAYTYSCGPNADGGCGEPIGFVFVVWGAAVFSLAVAFVFGRAILRNTSGE